MDLLNTTSFKTASEELLELRDVTRVHESIMVPGDIGVCHLSAAETVPRPQLFVQPIRFGSGKRNGVKDIKSSWA